MQKFKSNWLTMIKDTGEMGKKLLEFYESAEKKTALDEKTFQLVYITHLATAGILPGVRKHTQLAKAAGASREEIQSVFTAGFPVGAARLSEAYVVAMEAYDCD